MSVPKDITDLLTVDRIAADVDVHSKKRALETASGLLASHLPGYTEVDVLNCLLKRERLGTTGLGKGVAVPHGRLPGLERCLGAFVKLPKPVDYDAIDDQPVDLLFALVIPDDAGDEYLALLSHLAQIFSLSSFCERLRQCHGSAAMFDIMHAAEQGEAFPASGA